MLIDTMEREFIRSGKQRIFTEEVMAASYSSLQTALLHLMVLRRGNTRIKVRYVADYPVSGSRNSRMKA